MNIEVSSKNLAFLECFASETRVKIIELLNNRPMNIKELAAALDVTSTVITKHIQKLENAGIISSNSIVGKRGMQKICHLTLEQATLQIKWKQELAERNMHLVSIPVGQYTSFDVKPTCGLASPEKLIGMLDDPRYFADPLHVQAGLVWFGSGHVTYRIPNFLLSNQVLDSMEISLEICSEAPTYNENWPSDIEFAINNVTVGTWTSPGDFGKHRGVYTPAWWKLGTQHGLLKTITVNSEGTFLDGTVLSDIVVSDLGISYGKEILFRISCPEDGHNVGGVTLFGKGFGNYSQDIQVKMTYTVHNGK